MRYHAAIGAVGAFAAACLLGAVWTWRRPSALLLHLGMALVLAGWIVGLLASPREGSLRLRAGQIGSVGGAFNFDLKDFSIDYWEDTGGVRQYTSRGFVDGEPQSISVNHPLVKDGWWVYQNSYQEMTNPHTGKPLFFTILLCVKDTGLPLVFLGGILLLFGALLYLRPLTALRPLRPLEALKPLTPLKTLAFSLYSLAFMGALAMLVHRGLSTGHAPMQNMYEFLMCTAALLPILTFFAQRAGERHALLVDAALQALVLVPVAFFMDGTVKHLMPALQSPFFVPHVGAYVLGYVILVRAAFGVGRGLVGLGFLLLTLGLVLGAAWGKVCWGHWWQFDPKEMWSLATWFVYAAFFHVRARLSSRGETIFLAAGAAMIVLTLTWINLSRLFAGAHSYA
jgi:ABC-type transport system involved in cytochrome c biogenesis permease subunit